MENRLDQLTKALAGEEPGASAPVSRREALGKMGLGLVGALLASLGLGGKALAAPGGKSAGSGGKSGSPRLTPETDVRSGDGRVSSRS